MNQMLQKYYEDRLDMMASDAWRELMIDVEKMLKATDTLSGVTIDNLRFKQGEISIMQWLLNLQAASEQTFEQLKAENESIE